MFNISISDKSYVSKPTKTDYKKMVFNTESINTNQLKEIISKGYSFCCEFNSEQFNIKQKKTENYKQSQLIILDFDHSSISLDEVLSTIKIKPTIAFNSFSNTDTDHCFKLIYLFEEPIKSIEEHKLKSLMIVYLLFNQKELDKIKNSIDKSSFNPVQLCNGTNQRVELFNTIISIESINELFANTTEKFESFEEVFDLLGITDVFKSNENEVSHQRKSEENINHYNDFFCFPSMGQSYENINNSFYFRKSPFNNYHTAFIADSDFDKVYFYVGDQHIFSLTTYFKNGKIGDSRRHMTLLYIALVVRNIYPDNEDKVLYGVLRRYIDAYFIEPEKIDNATIRRIVTKVMNNQYSNTAGKKYYLLNPRFSSLTKKEKLSALQKIRAQRNQEIILSQYDFKLSLKENAKHIGYSSKTIRKYLVEKGLLDSRNNRVENYQRFLEIYSVVENQELSIRKLAELCGISKSQVQRYISKYLSGI